MAGTGPMPIRSGSTPATALATMRATGFSPSVLARLASTTSTAAAPSLRPEEFPAVTVPPALNAAGSLASISSVVSGRGCSSSSTRVVGPLRRGTSTGTTSCANRPARNASPARRWLSSAKRSCSSRVIPWRSATTSAVWPSEMVHRSGKPAFTKRQPSTVSATSGIPRGYAASGFSIT